MHNDVRFDRYVPILFGFLIFFTSWENFQTSSQGQVFTGNDLRELEEIVVLYSKHQTRDLTVAFLRSKSLTDFIVTHCQRQKSWITSFTWFIMYKERTFSDMPSKGDSPHPTFMMKTSLLWKSHQSWQNYSNFRLIRYWKGTRRLEGSTYCLNILKRNETPSFQLPSGLLNWRFMQVIGTHSAPPNYGSLWQQPYTE